MAITLDDINKSRAALNDVKDFLVKMGFTPAPAMPDPNAPPADPSQGGSMPMYPSQGGAPPMDPSQAGGAPPAGPSQGGGGAPPQPGGMDPETMEMLVNLSSAVTQMAPALSTIAEKVMDIEQRFGVLEQALDQSGGQPQVGGPPPGQGQGGPPGAGGPLDFSSMFSGGQGGPGGGQEPQYPPQQ